ncbi:hypothetical protein TIFTF001_013095 [Ficus carica]|uniref:Uncharacterized protein n=1 Tax=Ficus carica TaxID=3494 RepID=A0AA88A093_FICCA|nr:hypothetical protein TIFTF001_013095 [Ficus carica]
MSEFVDMFNIPHVEAFNENSERFVYKDCGAYLSRRSDLLKRGHSMNFSTINHGYKVPAFCVCLKLIGFQVMTSWRRERVGSKKRGNSGTGKAWPRRTRVRRS